MSLFTDKFTKILAKFPQTQREIAKGMCIFEARFSDVKMGFRRPNPAFINSFAMVLGLHDRVRRLLHRSACRDRGWDV